MSHSRGLAGYPRSRASGRAALFSAACATIAGCGSACPGEDCVPGASVVFSRALELSGEYSVRIVIDGKTSACSVASGEAVDCPFGAVRTNEATIRTPDGTPFPENGFAGMWIGGQPSRIEVTISEAEEVVASGEFPSIAYRAIEKNGPACGTCPAATVILTAP